MSGTQTLRDLVGAVEQVLVGKHAEAELAIIGLAAAGHLLIEDVPGVGKTMLAHVVLADEINRATPKTQSALLEAMEEHQVTVEGVTRPLPTPFIVLATQNPIEYEGTFPLPEAQLDRFLLRIHLGYPEALQEVSVLQRQMVRHPIDDLGPVTSAHELQQLQQSVRGVHVDPQIQRYIVHVVGLTRDHPDVYLGASP